jgi:glycosyltransferase involved in cell wall biosynthesis
LTPADRVLDPGVAWRGAVRRGACSDTAQRPHMSAEPTTRPTITVVTGSYNEEDNVHALYERLVKVFDSEPKYQFEIIWIDNCSQDRTVELLRELAQQDKRLKIIKNARNFGAIRSGYHVFMQAYGDAVIGMASDLQDPPEMLPDFIRKWEEGYKVVLAQKTQSEESVVFFMARRLYYKVVGRLSDVALVENATGFGLYDQRVMQELRKIEDPYPYMRGLVCDLGFKRALVPFKQPTRKRGFTKNNFYALYDIAFLGITSHSKVPLRLATMFGFASSGLSLFVGFCYFIYKLLFWNSFVVGQAPMVIGLFAFASVQLFFTGILGEYIGAIHTQVLRRPLVVEEERINFEPDHPSNPKR